MPINKLPLHHVFIGVALLLYYYDIMTVICDSSEMSYCRLEDTAGVLLPMIALRLERSSILPGFDAYIHGGSTSVPNYICQQLAVS